MGEEIHPKIQEAYQKVDDYQYSDMRLSAVEDVLGIKQRTLQNMMGVKIHEYGTEKNRFVLTKKTVKQLIKKHASAICDWPTQKELTVKYNLSKETINYWCKHNNIESELDFVGNKRISPDSLKTLEELANAHLIQTKEFITVDGDKLYLLKQIAKEITSKINYETESDKIKAENANYALLIRWTKQGKNGLKYKTFRNYWLCVPEKTRNLLMKNAFTIALREPREEIIL